MSESDSHYEHMTKLYETALRDIAAASHALLVTPRELGLRAERALDAGREELLQEDNQ